MKNNNDRYEAAIRARVDQAFGGPERKWAMRRLIELISQLAMLFSGFFLGVQWGDF